MESLYWADQVVDRLKRKNKKKYVVTCGTSPSGVIHVGKLREVMTAEIVYRAFKKAKVPVEFIHSYDDYDRFRKVPEGVPDSFKEHLGKPLTSVPDTLGKYKSYGERFEKEFMEGLDILGVKPKPIFQTNEYKKCRYKDEIKLALNKKDEIIKILNKHKTSNVEKSWWPINIYCSKCGRDTVEIQSYDGEYKLKYSCKCGNKEETDFSKTGNVKLVWRVDWPMRWAYYKIDYEPGGKDHFSSGGSFDTGKEIVKLYDYDVPDYSIYNQIKLKGQGIKMSSSLGNVVTIQSLTKVYYPEIVRFLYAGTKPNKEFDLPLDEDVIKTYEDFYKVERIYFGEEKVENEKKKVHWKRVYELSMPYELPKKLPIQPSFRKAVNLIQIYSTDKEVIKNFGLEIKTDWDKFRIEQIIKNARYWVEKYAPDKYKFRIMDKKHFSPNAKEVKAIKLMLVQIEDDKLTKEELYDVARLSGMEKEFFGLLYKIILNSEKGPRILQLIEMIGMNRFREILEKYV